MTDAVQVVVRVRPLNEKEISQGGNQSIIRVQQNGIHVSNPKVLLDPSYSTDNRVFYFDKCFSSDSPKSPEYADQEKIYSEIGQSVVENASSGFNCCIFAYGQTGSGKTHTMLGDSASSDLKGLVPRICQGLLKMIQEKRDHDHEEENNIKSSSSHSIASKGGIKTLHSVQVSYCEIYMEKVKDLLESHDDNIPHRPLRVREHPVTGPFVEGLVTRNVNSYEEIEEELAAGEKLRTVASTLMNSQSSRSHAIFTISFTQTTIDSSTLSALDKTSKISLIDLAGSERADTSGATGERLKEASTINKSLSTLGRVISTLSKPNHGRVPYRDSVLTWLLRESLGGNSKTTMFAMISPASENYEETMSTLRYAESAKKVINRAIVNEDPNATIIRQLREEIDDLRTELEALQRRRKSSAGNIGLSACLSERESMLSQLEESGRNIEATGSVTIMDNAPSLINLNENISSNHESLVYYLFAGANLFGCDPGIVNQEEGEEEQAESTQTAKAFFKEIMQSIHTFSGSDVNDYHCHAIPFESLSNLHACIDCNGEKLTLIPIPGSESKVNGVAIFEPTDLCHRDRVQFGLNCRFRVFVPSEAAAHRPSFDEDTLSTLTIACGDGEDFYNQYQADDQEEVEEKPVMEAKQEKIDHVKLQNEVDEANRLCAFLNLDYRLRLGSTCIDLGNDYHVPRVDVLLPDDRPSSVNWDPAMFTERLEMLRNMATLQEESSTLKKRRPSRKHSITSSLSVATEAVEEDPFFEVRSTAIRLMGHAQLHLAGIADLQEDHQYTLPIITTNGGQIGYMTCNVKKEYSKEKVLRAASALSPRSTKSVKKMGVEIRLLNVRFTTGFFSEGSYVTFRRWDEKTTHSTKKGVRTARTVFLLNHQWSTKIKDTSDNFLSTLNDAHILFDVWGWGNMEPLEKPESIGQLKSAIATFEQDSSQTGTLTDAALIHSIDQPIDEILEAESRHIKRRRSSVSISAKLDVFVSVDIEERGTDGVFQSVSVKEDGTFRLHQNRTRRISVRVTQADHQPFCLSTVRQVRLCPLGQSIPPGGKTRANKESGLKELYDINTPGKEWITLPERHQEVDGSSRSVTAYFRWGSSSDYGDSESSDSGAFRQLFLEDKCNKGERHIYRVALAFGSTKSDTPVVVSKTIQTKMYSSAGRFRARINGAWWSRDSYSRSQRLGSWYAVEVTRSQNEINPIGSQGTNQETLRAPVSNILTNRLLDIHGQGIARFDAVMKLDRDRQRVLNAMQCESAELSRLEKTYPIVNINGEAYLKSPYCHVYSHIKNGLIVDMDDAANAGDAETANGPTTHIVTEPMHFNSNAGEICGFLMMKETSRSSSLFSSGGSGWTRRWFVLQRPLLYFYKSFAKKKQLGVIDVSRCQISVHPSDAAAGIPFSFHLANGSQMWHFQASTAPELRAWLVAIDPLKIDARDAVVNQGFETTAPSA